MKLPENYVIGVGVVKPTGKGGLGQKMLEKMGWKDGEGLGKNKTGISEAIELKIKDNKDGVGKKTAFDWKVPFWENAYESGLKNVGKGGGSELSTSTQATGKSSSDSDSDSEDSDPKIGASKKRKSNFNLDGTVATAHSSELEIFNFLSKGRTGRWGGRGAKLGRIREQEQSLANEARKKLGLSTLPVDAPSQGVEQAPEKDGLHSMKSKKKSKKQKRRMEEEVAEGVKKTKKVAGVSAVGGKKSKKKKEKKSGGEVGAGAEKEVQCRGGKKQMIDKESEKKKKRKRKEEEEADDSGKLEGSLEVTDEPLLQKRRKKSSKKSKKSKDEGKPPSEASSDEIPEKREKKKKGKKSGEKKKKKKRKVVEVQVVRRVDLPERTPMTGWWGAKRFVSAGFDGEVKEVIPTDRLERHAFDEDDQVKVYMFAHNSKRRGTGGLGC